jgi:hypothetical protein
MFFTGLDLPAIDTFGPQRMRAQAHNLYAQARFPAIFTNSILINRIRIETPIKAISPVVLPPAETKRLPYAPMCRPRQLVLNHPLGSRVNRDEAAFGSLA